MLKIYLSLSHPKALNKTTIGIRDRILGIVALMQPPFSGFSISNLNYKAGLLLSSF